jgi:hypothetical protein
MGKQLQPQLQNAHEIKEILKEVEFAHTLTDGRKVKTLLVYLPIVKGKSSHTEFFEKIKDGILANFIFSCTEIEKKMGLENKNGKDQLFIKSIRKLSKHTAQGELGELLLFTLLDVYLMAPKLLSKIAMKTSPTMPVFGADGVHGQFYDGSFRVYLGEAKLHTQFKSAASYAAVSSKSAKDTFGTEFNLLDSFMDFPGMDEDIKNELLELIDPFSGKDITGIVHSSCFIGFAKADMFDDEKAFLEKYEKLAKDYVENFFNKVEKQDLNVDETVLIMLPFTCVKELVKEFIAYMGITQ